VRGKKKVKVIMNEGEKGVEDMEEDELGKGGNVEFVKEKERWGC
jgi:hypothetical protein